MIASLFVVRWRPTYDILRVGSLVARITVGLAALTTGATFIIDVITVVLTREKLNTDANGLVHVDFGNAVRRLSFTCQMLYISNVRSIHVYAGLDYACRRSALNRSNGFSIHRIPHTETTIQVGAPKPDFYIVSDLHSTELCNRQTSRQTSRRPPRRSWRHTDDRSIFFHMPKTND